MTSLTQCEQASWTTILIHRRLNADPLSSTASLYTSLRAFMLPIRNMNAWIDCMSYLDDPNARMTGIHVESKSVLTLELTDAKQLRENYPELYGTIVECSSFVNWRRVDVGEHPIIAPAMDG